MKKVTFALAFLNILLAGSSWGAVLVYQTPSPNGGVSRWSQLWQDPGPGGNDLDSDAVCWTDFSLSSTTKITHLEWWGTGACELGFQIEFWPQDPGTIAYQPLAVFDRGPGPSPVTPEARFLVTPADYITESGPGNLVRYRLELPAPVTLPATNSANPRWFVGIIGLTHQAFVTWNWSQGVGGSTRTYQWLRADANHFRSLGDGRALVIADDTHETPPHLSITGATSNAVVLSWPANAVGFALQHSFSCGTNWLATTNAVSAFNGHKQAIIKPSNSNYFFRLIRP